MKIHDFAGDSMRFVHLMAFRLPADRKLFLSSDLQVLPYFDIPYGRIGIAELILCVMAHDNVQCMTFFLHIFYEFYFPTAHGTLRAHTVAASYLLV